MMIYVDIETGTWGDAERIRVLDAASVSVEHIAEITKALLNGSDNEIKEIGERFGKAL